MNNKEEIMEGLDCGECKASQSNHLANRKEALNWWKNRIGKDECKDEIRRRQD